jgi:hypothetical protein
MAIKIKKATSSLLLILFLDFTESKNTDNKMHKKKQTIDINVAVLTPCIILI